MKLLFIAVVLMISGSAFSAIELYGKMGNAKCVITKNSVTKTVTFKKLAGFTTSKTISLFGIKELANKAAASATARQTTLDYAFSISIDGVVSPLHIEDSAEATTLVQLINKACSNV